MHVKRVTDTEVPNTSLELLESRLHTVYTKHIKAMTGVQVERANRGKASGPLVDKLEVRRDEGETTEEDAVNELVRETLDIVRTDSLVPRGRNTPNAGQVGPWSGVVVVMNAKLAADKRRVQVVAVELEDPDAHVSEKSLTLDVMKTMVTLVEKFGAASCNLHRANAVAEKQRAKRDKQLTKLVASVAKSVTKSSGRWDYKKHKEQMKTERSNEEWRARQAQSKHIWEAVAEVGAEYSEVAEIWSRYFTFHRKPGDPPKPPPTRPTREECDAILNEEHYEKPYDIDGVTCSLRSTVMEMLATADAQERLALSKRLPKILNRMGLILAGGLRTKMVSVVGEERAQAIAAWLSMPAT